jgi:aryl-alcohol dehydrogenase-like predicted oxidoreductase
VMESIERSLKALNTDYVDVYLIHWPDRTVPFEETMRAFGAFSAATSRAKSAARARISVISR